MPRNAALSEKMRADAREAILAAAFHVFGEKGFAGTGTRAVAEAAGVSGGLVFRYFPTKDALLQAMIERALGEALAYWEAEKWEGAPAQQLARLVEGAIAQVCARPHFYRLYFSLVLQPGGSAAVGAAVESLKARLDAYYGRTARLMALLRSDDPVADARLFQFALNGLAQAIVSDPNQIGRPDLLPIDALKARLLARFLPHKDTP